MSELQKLGIEKREYMNRWLAAGNKLSEIIHDKTFQDYRKKEDALIAERNERILQEGANNKLA